MVSLCYSLYALEMGENEYIRTINEVGRADFQEIISRSPVVKYLCSMITL